MGIWPCLDTKYDWKMDFININDFITRYSQIATNGVQSLVKCRQ